MLGPQQKVDHHEKPSHEVGDSKTEEISPGALTLVVVLGGSLKLEPSHEGELLITGLD